MRRVEHALADAAARSPRKPALVVGDERLSYAQLDERTARLASSLRGLGVARGDRVAVWLPNGVEAAVAIYAILRAGAAFVVLDASLKTDRLAAIVRDCGAACLFAPAAKVGAARAALGDGGPRIVAVARPGAGAAPAGAEATFAELLSNGDAGGVRDPGIDRDLACLVYTSGSSGEPKGIMSAHHNVDFAVRSITTYLGNTADDVVLSASPLSFDYGLYQLLMVVHFGGTLVLEPFTYPAAFLERLAAERATGLPGVPTMWAMLLGMDLGAFDLSSLRYATNTGASLPPAHVRALRERLPHVRLYSMYGLTETKRTLYMPPEHLDAHPGSVGIAIPGTEVWLEDDDGRRVADGEVGELIVRGGHVMLGYWNAPEATARRFPPGPLPGERLCRSGDLFTRDANGFHWFVGRRDDVLKSRGQKVAPAEVEAVLHELAGVREAAVVGVEHAVLGHALRAYVVAHAGATLAENDVLRHCRARLEDFKVPSEVVFVDALPQGSQGKVRRRDLA